ncbi:MAG: hypothetical protein J6Y95_03385, partial [Lachnospiraceae bacterium]|nr:hypothetical protein [Lachnospiraceae bacterium]
MNLLKHTLTLCLGLSLSASVVGMVQDGHRVGEVPSEEGLFPFMISYDMARGATDYSSLLDAPAGKHGFTRVEGQHFVNDVGRIRFNGVNIVGGANFPSHVEAERMAKRLAHFGFNCVRLHYFDLVEYGFREIREKGLLVDDGTFCTLDPEQLDRFDYMVWQFKKHGIYIDVNLLVGRRFKGRNAYDKDLQQKELDYARNLFTHVNPYTGLSLAEEPAVAMVELNNEDAILMKCLRQKDWKPEEGGPAWPSMDELKDRPDGEKRKMLHVLEAADRDHWNRQREFLIRELGLKVPVTSTQLSYSSPWAFMD